MFYNVTKDGNVSFKVNGNKLPFLLDGSCYAVDNSKISFIKMTNMLLAGELKMSK